MPTYLLHGFRWPRPLIRIHIILQNLDDAAAEWLCGASTTQALMTNFRELFPESMPHLPALRFVEQYDPNDLSAASLSQPYAYVADIIEEVKLGLDVDDVRGRGVNNEQWGALMELRDRLAPDEKVGWWIVVCGDEERWAPPTNDLIRGGFPVSNNSQTNGDVYEQYLERDARNGRSRSKSRSRAKGKSKEEPPLPNSNSAHSGLGTSIYGNGYRDDPGLRELREQIGYRTNSDESYRSSDAATRNTSATTPTLGAGGKTPEWSTPDTPSSTGSPKKQPRGVKGWLAKRRSQKSLKELAKIQSREAAQAPPLPTSSPAMSYSSRLPVR